MNFKINKNFSKHTCNFLDKLAKSTVDSYSLIGPYEPKKPKQLLIKNK